MATCLQFPRLLRVEGMSLMTREVTLINMIRFAEDVPGMKIVSALRTQLDWTHFRQIVALDDPLRDEQEKK